MVGLLTCQTHHDASFRIYKPKNEPISIIITKTSNEQNHASHLNRLKQRSVSNICVLAITRDEISILHKMLSGRAEELLNTLHTDKKKTIPTLDSI